MISVYSLLCLSHLHLCSLPNAGVGSALTRFTWGASVTKPHVPRHAISPVAMARNYPVHCHLQQSQLYFILGLFGGLIFERNSCPPCFVDGRLLLSFHCYWTTQTLKSCWALPLLVSRHFTMECLLDWEDCLRSCIIECQCNRWQSVHVFILGVRDVCTYKLFTEHPLNWADGVINNLYSFPVN